MPRIIFGVALLTQIFPSLIGKYWLHWNGSDCLGHELYDWTCIKHKEKLHPICICITMLHWCDLCKRKSECLSPFNWAYLCVKIVKQKERAFSDPWQIGDHESDCSVGSWWSEFLYFLIPEAYWEVIWSRHSIHIQGYGVDWLLSLWGSRRPSSRRAFKIPSK
jgi:hypothetical protein